ncbi:MAG: PQQ-binding-like beta-propeller repeat protein, partial [Gammaproteobacteria bacterium]|nr:PQQ-binding-like beta-propeller repeat protein [Gammaproteobacteria bacterium]
MKITIRSRIFFTCLILVLTGQPLAQTSSFNPVTTEMLTNPSPDDWLMLGRTYDEQRFSPLDEVNRDNVDELQMVWSRGMPDGTQQTIPTVYDGVMYLISPINSVVAMDATNGDLIWEYNREAPEGVRLSAIRGISSKSLAIYHDMIYYTSPDGYLVALDAKDGSVRWEVESYEPGSGSKNSSAPIVVEGNVITARACRNYANCYIGANDAMTGEEVWRFHTAAGEGDYGGDSWGNVPTENRVASPWGLPGSYDPDSGLIYWG